MDLTKLSLDPIKNRRVAILGYGNQGRAHALNLRDSGVSVLIGSRPGKSWDKAREDGFSPVSPESAAREADILVFLFPDQVIPGIYAQVSEAFGHEPKIIGFAHGFAYHYRLISHLPNCQYFLVGPKGAGAILREKFTAGDGLPGVFALGSASSELREICLAYAKGIGCAKKILLETTFQEETECDLFGEQTVLCGGLPQLMEGAFDTLVRHGHSPEMAFFECCFEAKMILELWMKAGPAGMVDRISPTAFFGGLSRGKRLITGETKAEMEKVFHEIRNGAFAKEWLHEVERGTPTLKAHREHLKHSKLQAVFEKLKESLT